MIEILIAGIISAFTLACHRDPSYILVVSQTLKHGSTEGVKVAFAP
jgi:threonine/homoserine/homoserine lactone efflux protein